MKYNNADLIQAVTVNHNTSKFTELMLRSLYDKHAPDLNIVMTVMDNGSNDDMSGLRAFLDQKQIPLQQSGFSTDTEWNSHGEVLRQFVVDHPNCAYYLFLDSDVYFLQDGTIDDMLAELNTQEELFGVGVRQSWDGLEEIPTEIHEVIYYRRLHPCCALIRNTPNFRRIVEEVGLTGLTYHWVGGGEYWDTFELMTKIMRTHELRHTICATMIYHFFCVSYDPRYMERKHRECDKLLTKLRNP